MGILGSNVPKKEGGCFDCSPVQGTTRTPQWSMEHSCAGGWQRGRDLVDPDCARTRNTIQGQAQVQQADDKVVRPDDLPLLLQTMDMPASSGAAWAGG